MDCTYVYAAIAVALLAALGWALYYPDKLERDTKKANTMAEIFREEE